MEVDLYVPLNADLTVILGRYPDLSIDESAHADDEFIQCWIGSADEGEEWLTYDEAIDFCGFCEGAIPDAQTMLEGNGGWAQSMIRRRDFSTFAATDAEKAWWKATSDRYWAAFECGKRAATMAARQ